MAAAVMLLYAAAVLLRFPPLVNAPSFWAEEGSAYFAFAYGHGWLASLLQSPLGYFSLLPNLACTLAAKLAPLEHSPLVTVGFAFLVQLVPPAIILSSRAAHWAGLGTRVLGVLIVLFTLMSTEVWLNTINSQFVFSLVAFLILEEPGDGSPARNRWYRLLLLLAGLTGLISLVLSPLFLWRFLRERSRQSAWYVGILSACAAVHAVSIASAGHGGGVLVRLGSPDLLTLIDTLATRVALVYGGIASATDLYGHLGRLAAARASGSATRFALTLLLIEALLFSLLYLGVPKQRRPSLFGSYFLLFLLSAVFSAHADKRMYVNPFMALRYFWVPGVILLIITLAAIDFRGGAVTRIRAGVAALLFAAALIFGVTQFRVPGERYSETWPRWSDEVALWRADNNHAMRIWPYNWPMRLSASDRR